MNFKVIFLVSLLLCLTYSIANPIKIYSYSYIVHPSMTLREGEVINTVLEGEVIHYELTVENTSSSTLPRESVVVTVTIDNGFKYIPNSETGSSKGWSFDYEDRVIRFKHLSEFTARTSRQLSYRVQYVGNTTPPEGFVVSGGSSFSGGSEPSIASGTDYDEEQEQESQEQELVQEQESQEQELVQEQEPQEQELVQEQEPQEQELVQEQEPQELVQVLEQERQERERQRADSRNNPHRIQKGDVLVFFLRPTPGSWATHYLYASTGFNPDRFNQRVGAIYIEAWQVDNSDRIVRVEFRIDNYTKCPMTLSITLTDTGVPITLDLPFTVPGSNLIVSSESWVDEGVVLKKPYSDRTVFDEVRANYYGFVNC